LISHNPQRFDKQLWSALDHGEAVRVLPCTDEPHEAAQVVEDLLAHRTQRSVALSDYAILYRGNHQARVFEEALRARGVNYTVSGGASFFARPEIKDAVAYMQLLANGSDNNALLRIINTPKRDLGPEILEQLAQFAQQHAMSLLQACAQAETIPALAEGASGRLRQFHAQVQRGAQQAARLGATAGLRALLDDIHYNLWLEAQAMSSKTADKRKHNVGSLLAWLTRLEQQEPALQAPKALVARLALRDLLERRDEQTGTGVALMTLHAAKGLEFPYVYLAGLEEGLLPHQHSLDEGGIEEERRLCYVGITRAQRRLTLSYAQTRRSGTAPKTSTPSRFITELGDGLHWERQPSNLLPAKETRRQRLAELRTLLE
jgi:ATP-dependent DNA helicase Rep